MPYELREGPKGKWTVHTQGTGKAHSKEPLSRAQALAQMRALYANMKPGEK